MRKTKKIGGSNVLVTVLLFLGCLTILFPLYMTIIIAFKNPSEMTNDVAGALAFPSSWKLDNFKEAMEVTNFWHTLGNSLLITIATIVLTLLIHSLAGYVIGRNMARKKGYRFIYFYIVSGMFVPFAILMMPLVKETAILGLDNRLGVILLYLVFYMPMNVMLYSGYLKNIPLAMEEAAEIDGATKWQQIWHVTLPSLIPMITIMLLLSVGGIMRSDTGLFYQVTRNSGTLFSTTQVIDSYVLNAILKNPNFGFVASTTFFQSVVGTGLILICNGIVRKLAPENALF